MKEKNYTGLVPKQHTGKPIDAHAELELDDDAAARSFFQLAKERLFNVNGWHELAGNLSAEFQLVDAQGNEVQRAAQKGDFLKVDVPGPGTDTGDGYDWVEIEAVENYSDGNIESTGFRVRPASNPQNAADDVAHFYSPDSTSTFTVTREKNVLTAAIYDRNTKVNTETDKGTDQVRDAVVGAGGIYFFSKIQWKSLAEGILEDPEE